MEKSIFERMGGTYHKQGDYLLPDIAVPEEDKRSIGVWGLRRREYLKKHKEAVYTGLLLAGKLAAHLAEIDQQAEEMFSHLVERMAQVEGISEELKATDQMVWVGRMNNIRSRMKEIVSTELIYA